MTTVGHKVKAAPSARSMTAEHALLGVLAIARDGTGHGYELARSFAPGSPLGSVLHLEAGMVYHHVKKLEKLGWLRLVSDGGRRPGRRTVAITEAGRAELHAWLTEPVQHTREVRLEFLVKLYLALQLDAVTAQRLLREQHERLLTVRESLAGDSPEGEDGVLAFGALVRDLRATQTEAALSWLTNVQQHMGE